MICADSRSLIAFLAGDQGQDVELIRTALVDGSLVLAPVAVSELLSDPELPPSVEGFVLEIPQLEITPGFWERAGKLRARLIRQRFRPKLADTLIAQCCIDHRVPLTTRDRDFSAFQKFAGLQLLCPQGRVQ